MKDITNAKALRQKIGLGAVWLEQSSVVQGRAGEEGLAYQLCQTRSLGFSLDATEVLEGFMSRSDI